MPYSEQMEMDKAMKDIRVSRAVPAPQRKWLEQIGQRLKVEVVVYRGRSSRDSSRHKESLRKLIKCLKIG